MEKLWKYWQFHRWVHRRIGTHRYFTKSWKNYGLVPQLPTSTLMDSPTESSHPEAHACQRRGRSARLPMESPVTLFPTDRKVRRDFQNFWCEYQFITAKNYRRNLMPPTTINCLSVTLSEKLVYKTPLPPFGSFYLSALISISLLLSVWV